MVCNADNPELDFIGRLTKIIRIDYEPTVLTLINVQWYYRKTDLNNSKIDLELISENEVFLTEHTDFIFVDTINGSCNILTYDDYD
mmetsp:Transcript_66145/g.92006  ORF Transcript_66145/g.92006 Transcript_66145/m.92006 type:complete len:86 (-) Transcript_66145:157-414(-)